MSRHQYRCPLCLKSIGDMTAYNHTVDAHLSQTGGAAGLAAALGADAPAALSLVLCNDCELRYGVHVRAGH
jgi:hypothetical protein